MKVKVGKTDIILDLGIDGMAWTDLMVLKENCYVVNLKRKLPVMRRINGVQKICKLLYFMLLNFYFLL